MAAAPLCHQHHLSPSSPLAPALAGSGRVVVNLVYFGCLKTFSSKGGGLAEGLSHFRTILEPAGLQEAAVFPRAEGFGLECRAQRSQPHFRVLGFRVLGLLG